MEYGDKYVDSMGLFYDINEKHFLDDDGFIVDMGNVYCIVPPWFINLFLEEKKYMVYEKTPNFVVELFWPDDEQSEFLSGVNDLPPWVI